MIYDRWRLRTSSPNKEARLEELSMELLVNYLGGITGLLLSEWNSLEHI
jgi:hypothetical protein